MHTGVATFDGSRSSIEMKAGVEHLDTREPGGVIIR
jgi:hypothetical protein